MHSFRDTGMSSAESVRAVLDGYDVGGRLKYIRDFIWRGGAIDLEATRGADEHLLRVSYALHAEWPAPVLEPEDDSGADGLVRSETPVVEGRWVRGCHRYELRIGIDLRAPAAMYVRSPGFASNVPFLGRQPQLVEAALNAELTRYVNGFLDHFQPVPQATAADARRLRAFDSTP